MRKIMIILICLLAFSLVKAQKINPEIKTGTTLYSFAMVNGQEFPLILTIKSIQAPVSIGWEVDGYGEGWFTMTAKAVDSATRMIEVTQPAIGETKLGDIETFALISKTAFKSLLANKELILNGQKFKFKASNSNPMKINGAEIDAFHIVNEKGDLELWILNNASFPLVVQSKGMATDILVNEIK